METYKELEKSWFKDNVSYNKFKKKIKKLNKQYIGKEISFTIVPVSLNLFTKDFELKVITEGYFSRGKIVQVKQNYWDGKFFIPTLEFKIQTIEEETEDTKEIWYGSPDRLGVVYDYCLERKKDRLDSIKKIINDNFDYLENLVKREEKLNILAMEKLNFKRKICSETNKCLDEKLEPFVMPSLNGLQRLTYIVPRDADTIKLFNNIKRHEKEVMRECFTYHTYLVVKKHLDSICSN